jgi:hypothetical protein
MAKTLDQHIELTPGVAAGKSRIAGRRAMRVGRMIRGLLLIHQVLDSTDMQNHVEYL